MVAEEVKNLAEDSREAAERIAKMIKEVQQETSKAVDSMKRGTKNGRGHAYGRADRKSVPGDRDIANTTAREVAEISTLMSQTERGHA